MGRFVFKLHHNEKELLEFEKKEKNLKVRERIRAIRLMMYSGHSKKLICEMIGRGRSTVLDWCHRYNKKGIEGLRDSKNLGGSVALCDIIGRDIIEDALSKPPPDGGLWTGPKLISNSNENSSSRPPVKIGSSSNNFIVFCKPHTTLR